MVFQKPTLKPHKFQQYGSYKMVCMEWFDLWEKIRSLKSTKKPDLQSHNSIIDLLCSPKHILPNSPQWVITHPSQHKCIHSIHFINMPKGIRLWDVMFWLHLQ